MTSPPAPPSVIPRADPPPGSRLEQLLDMREAAIAAAKEAKDRLDAIDAGIKTEVAGAYPGQPVIDIAGSPHRAPLRLRYHEGTWYVPADTLRKTQPDIWNALAKQKRGHWQLHPVDGGGS